MNASYTTRLACLALSALMSLAILSGIDRLATAEPVAAAGWASSAPAATRG